MIARLFKRAGRATVIVSTSISLALLLIGQRASLGQVDKTADTLFRQVDANADGKVTMDEATVGTRSFLSRIFEAAGKKPTDSLTRDEFLAAYDRYKNKAPAATSAPGRSPSPATDETSSPSDDKPAGLMGMADTNGDAKLSRAEWSKLAQNFSKLDLDKDNSLDQSELAATQAAELLTQLADASGDKKISRVEWGKLAQSFARLDTNKDNNVDEAELKAAAEAAGAAASGSASLPATKTGPILWRGNIEGRGQIELLVNGTYVVGRDINRDGSSDSLGAGTITMTGDGKSGNMDALYTEGQNRGQLCMGIYRLEGDKLTWCVNNRGSRPQGFQGGNGNWLLTLTRVESVDTTK